ncbi:MAG: alpha/beta fold hydrolase [Elainellaceae cyanobacterium]
MQSSESINRVSDQGAGLASPAPQFYEWRGYRGAYEVRQVGENGGDRPPLLLIHPIGVGLSRRFWYRFAQEWVGQGQASPLYLPDLLGCGDSDMPHVAYYPADWAAQLLHFLKTVVQTPAIVVAQGALFPVAIALSQQPQGLDWMRGLILAGPPAWPIMTNETPSWQDRLSWSLFDSPLGSAFYRYARRREFLRSFSARQLFADEAAVDAQWLDTLEAGAQDPASRHAVYSFLSGFWRQDYTAAIEALDVPTLVVLGETASSIGRSGRSETPDERMSRYLEHLPQGQGVTTPGRNVLPYEATGEFVAAIAPFVNSLRQ